MVTNAAKSRHKFSTDRISAILIYVILVLAGLICLFPFINVLAKSLSGESAVLAGDVKIIPVDIQTGAYKYVFTHKQILISLKNTIYVTVVGMFLSILVLCLTAYPLSKAYLKGGKFITMLYVFTLIFSGGLIPGYLLVRSLGLYDTLWALILPAIVSPYNLLILISFIKGIPASLEESAKIDGAGYTRTLFTIIIPLSKPAIASLTLFIAVGQWNDFFRPLIFIQKQELYTLQLYLRSILLDVNDLSASLDITAYGNIAPQSVQYATIIVSIIPILLFYPFLQKYFVTGMTLGAIKG